MCVFISNQLNRQPLARASSEQQKPKTLPGHNFKVLASATPPPSTL